MSNWKTYTLGKLVKSGGGKIHTGPFGSQLHASDYVQSGIPCIMPANMKENRVDLSGISFISEQDAARLSKYLVKGGDIVYSRRGDVTLKALIKDEEEGFFCGTGCLLLRPGSEIDPEFLTYYLSTDSIKHWIVKQAVGATMPNLNTGIFSSIPFTAPTKKEQQKLAAVISSINQKIELNNKINAELEAMAKLIYDYWFVQFDFPDANGKPYKSSGGKMAYNKALKREIPEGWEAVPLDYLVNVITGNVSPKDMDPNTPYIGLEHIPRKTIVLSEWETAKKVNSDKCVFKKYDILFGKIRPYFHKVGITFVNGITSTDTIVLRPKKEEFFGLAIQTVFTDIFIETATQTSTGTKMPRANWTVLKNYKVAIPSSQLLNKYQSIIDGVFSRIESSVYQNKKLSTLRDWLLPLLMNGQVTVKETEEKFRQE